jgi:hypothetical protein
LYNSQDAGNSLAKLREDYRDIIPILRALPPDRVIYTNVASDIYMVSGRYARDLPEVRGHTDARPRTEEEISAQVRDLSEQVSGSGGGLVVYHLRNRTLSDLSFIWWDDLSRRVPMTLVFHSEAFAVFAGDHEVRRGSNPYTEYENAEFSCPFVRLPACYPAPEAMVL